MSLSFFLPYCPCSRCAWSPYPPPQANMVITGNLRGQFPPTLMDLYPKHLHLSTQECPPDTGACSVCVLGRLGVAERDTPWSITQPVRSENGWASNGKTLRGALHHAQSHPESSNRMEHQLPTTVSCSLARPSLASFLPCLSSPLPHHRITPNKPLHWNPISGSAFWETQTKTIQRRLPSPWHLCSFSYDPICQSGITQGAQAVTLDRLGSNPNSATY